MTLFTFVVHPYILKDNIVDYCHSLYFFFLITINIKNIYAIRFLIIFSRYLVINNRRDLTFTEYLRFLTYYRRDKISKII